jgi:hypothetical protein
VWVNDEAVGAHEGGYTGFELQIDDLLIEGENFIAVRIITPLITRDVVIDGLGRDDMPHWRGAITGGIWQPVSLMATGTVYVDDTFVTTDINTGKVTIASTFQNQGLKLQSTGVEWTITEFNENTPIASSLVKLSLNPDIAGIGIHALNDGDWVLGAGLIDNFRNPKKPYYAIKKVFADRYIAIRPSDQNVYAGRSVQILLTSVNDGDILSGTLLLRVKANDGQTLLDVNEKMIIPNGIIDLGAYDINTERVEGRCHIDLSF